MIAATMLPAAPVTQKTVSGPSCPGGVRLGRPLDQADGPAQVVGVADLDRARDREASRRSGARASAAALRLGGKSTAFTSASGRSRARDLVKPVTAPPMSDGRAGGVVAVAAAEARSP